MTARHADNLFAVANPRAPALASYVLAVKLRSFDWHKRLARKHLWGKVTSAVLQDLCDRLNAIVQLA
jgi:mRNA-degrading endonuclease toxin of MazEF toxin-antitoxin module